MAKNEIKVGDKVQVRWDHEYGNAKGVVINVRGEELTVNCEDGNQITVYTDELKEN